MKTYCFKVVKIEKSIVAQNKYRCLSKLNPNLPDLLPTLAPDIYRSTKTNEYLLDLKVDNIEMVRFLANTLLQAETSLFPNDRFLCVLVYECELGQAITNETPMTLLLDVRVNEPRAFEFFDPRATWREIDIAPRGFYSWRSWRSYRHTARGSGRYEPVFVKDPPKYYNQRCLMIDDFGALKQAKNDDFIGLDVAFGRRRGKPLKHVYMGAVSSDNYVTDALGVIGLHRKGNLYHGAFDNYEKSMSILWPLMSGRQFDADGVLIEAPRVAANGVPNLVTEFKAQRRAAYTKAGDSERLKTRLVVMLSDYVDWFCNFINQLQAWGHNLNFDVSGFESTKGIYLRAERILRLISAYFPRELPLTSLKLDSQSATTEIPESETLVLANRFEQIAEAWDRLVLLCDWMRRNYVDYTLSPKIPDYVKQLPTDFAQRDFLTGTGWGSFALDSGNFSSVAAMDAYAQSQAVGEFEPKAPIHLLSEYPSGSTWYNSVENVRKMFDFQVNFNRFRRTYKFDARCGKTIYTGTQGQRHVQQWSDYNQWLEQTSEIAADIEQVYLAFQLNSLAFAELLTHLLTILDSKPRRAVNRRAGKLPGEISVSSEQKKNKKWTHPSALKDAPKDDRQEGELKDLELTTVPLLDFKPLAIDARAIIKRCAKDVTEQDEDEQEEEDKERQAQLDEIDRKRFAEQQEEIERRKARAQKRPRFKWRNEIDPLTDAQAHNERVSLYNEIADNLNTVADVAEAVNDVLAAFAIAACTPDTPLVLGEKVAFKTAATGFRKSVRKVADGLSRVDWPDLPERDDYEPEVEIESPELTQAPPGQVPRPRVRHKYKPPREDETPEFTGDEDDPREWELCENQQGTIVREGVFLQGTRFGPARSNCVDLQIVKGYEAGGLRKLVQLGLKYFDDVAEGATNCDDPPESNPQSRYRCFRAQTRVPRS